MPATQRKCIYEGLTLDVDRHYIGSVTAATHHVKGIITLESNLLRGTVLPAPHGKGNKCDKNVKYKRTDALSLWHQQYSTTVDIRGFLFTEQPYPMLPMLWTHFRFMYLHGLGEIRWGVPNQSCKFWAKDLVIIRVNHKRRRTRMLYYLQNMKWTNVYFNLG